MEKYLKDNKKSIDNIFDACVQLNLSILPRTTACILYHRCLRKQKELHEETTDKQLLAATCVYLASKIDEEPVKIRDLINVFHRLTHPENKPLDIDKPYWNLRDSVTTTELILLRLLNFQVIFHTPHKYLLHYLQLLEDWALDLEEWKRRKFSQICLNISNDACYSPLISDAPPQVISAAIIYFVSSYTMLNISEGENGKQWFSIFCPNTSEDELRRIACTLMRVYESQPSTAA